MDDNYNTHAFTECDQDRNDNERHSTRQSIQTTTTRKLHGHKAATTRFKAQPIRKSDSNTTTP